MSSVASRSEDTLKQLLAIAPPGLLLDSPWLAQHGVSRQLVYYYAQRGWLERVAHGVYRLHAQYRITVPDHLMPSEQASQ